METRSDRPTETEVYTLFSGSSGNAVYLRSPTAEILIDAGVSARRLHTALGALGSGLDRIDAVFVTHEHSDHIAGIETMSRHYPARIHLTEASAPHIRCDGDRAVIHPPLYTETVGDLTVTSFVTSHDSEGSVGFIVTAPDVTVGLATDLGYMSVGIIERLAGCDAVILESNHDPDLLRRGPYPYPLKQRILSRRGHLSNPDCARCAVYLAGHGVRRILLAHLSEVNNTPEAALAATQTALTEAGLAAACPVRVAARFAPTRLI